MEKSFQRQLEILKKNGVALHSLWHGDGEEEIEGLKFVYYSIEGIQKLVPKGFKILEKAIYKEIENDDSICLIMRKRDTALQRTRQPHYSNWLRRMRFCA